MAPFRPIRHDEHDLGVALQQERLHGLAHGHVEGRPVTDLLDVSHSPAPALPNLLVHGLFGEIPKKDGKDFLLLDQIGRLLAIHRPGDHLLEDDGRDHAWLGE